jgi:hypothetical protein
MKRLIYLFSIIGAFLVFTSCSEDKALAPEPDSAALAQSDEASPLLKSASKPAAHLLGIMDLYFDLAATWPEEPVWIGTVTLEGYGVYGMQFFHLTEFRDYSQASPFEEWFEIYDLTTGVVVLAGPDVGVTTLANKPPDPCKYRMNGEIEEAETPFEGWLGRHVHMSGEITWQILQTPDGPVAAPATAPGTLRIN